MVIPVVARAVCVPRVPEGCRVVVRRFVSNTRCNQDMDPPFVGNGVGGSVPLAQAGAPSAEGDDVLRTAEGKTNGEMWMEWESTSEDEPDEEPPILECSSSDSESDSEDEGKRGAPGTHVHADDLVGGGVPAYGDGARRSTVQRPGCDRVYLRCEVHGQERYDVSPCWVHLRCAEALRGGLSHDHGVP